MAIQLPIRENEMRFFGGLIVFFGLLIIFMLTMFVMIAEADMGADDQSFAELRLSTCTTDTDCAEAYDAVYGLGAAGMLEELFRGCGAPVPGANCPLDENGEIIEGPGDADSIYEGE